MGINVKLFTENDIQFPSLHVLCGSFFDGWQILIKTMKVSKSMNWSTKLATQRVTQTHHQLQYLYLIKC